MEEIAFVVVLALLVALLAFAAGAYVLKREVRVEVEVPVLSGRLRAPRTRLRPGDGHEHQWTTMSGADGLWRCKCGTAAPDEKQPLIVAAKRAAAAAEEQASG